MNNTLLELQGSVDKIVFRNEKNGYSVIELSVGDNNEYVTAVGIMPCVSIGEHLKLIGVFKSHPTFGDQFSVEVCERSMPTTVAAILKYLSSGAIKGVGQATAIKLVEAFGEQTLEIIEKEPHRLTEVNGITKARAKKIADEYVKIFGINELMSFLNEYNVTPEESIRAYKFLGSDCIDIIKNNPYILCGEPINISFDKADNIAIFQNTPFDHEYRVRAGIIYVLKHNTNNGHTCLPKDKLIPATASFLEISSCLIEEQLELLIEDGSLQQDTFNNREFIFLNALHQSEVYIAGRLLMMLKFPPQCILGALDDIQKIEKNSQIGYADLQKKAICDALEKGILILTGGPGTGKTTTLNAIINILEAKGEKVFLAAPTGRAAQRMSAVTSREAKTIHRLLEVEWDKQDKPSFKKNEKNLLDCDALILDELSMVDVSVFEGVLRALPLGCRLIMVGDSDQLPSVGAGNVLADLIKSELIPTVKLTEIFRQSMESLIVTNAHKIVNGELPDLSSKDSNFFFIKKTDPLKIGETIKDLCLTRLPNTYGFSPFFDIQVIAPGRKGELGTNNLNKILQSVLNPSDKAKNEININGNVLREGDKVMQIKNNYDIPFVRDDETMGEGVFNGDIGILIEINKQASSITVKFDDKIAQYTTDNASDLELAYAITVHKSQGSEFPAVIMPMYNGAPQLYYRNLLYTAVTRAKSILVMVGTPWTVANMVNNNKKNLRYSGLFYLLTNGNN